MTSRDFYLGRLRIGAVFATVPLVLAALAIVSPTSQGDIEGRCSSFGTGDVLDELGDERHGYQDRRYDDDNIRWFRPARVCKVYAVRESEPSPEQPAGTGEVLVAEEARPEGAFYLLVPIMLVLPLLFHRRGLGDDGGGGARSGS